MPRTTTTTVLGQREPRLGDVVLFHPKRVNNPTRELAAIVQYVSDPAQGLVDLSVFTDAGPVVKKDVLPGDGDFGGGWTHRA